MDDHEMVDYMHHLAEWEANGELTAEEVNEAFEMLHAEADEAAVDAFIANISDRALGTGSP